MMCCHEKNKKQFFRLIPIACCLLLFCTSSIGQNKQQPPNIILILADDLGWSDLSCYGSSFYETPVLDSLAAKGIKFTNNYAASPVCSPTRASLLTGKYPIKTGVTDWIRGRQENGKARPFEKLIGPSTAYQLSLNETTLAELALTKGYKTFFAGKWHLGEEEAYWPDHQGFQTNIGGWGKGSPFGKVNDSTGGYFTPYKNPTITDGPEGEYLTDRLTNECIRFINANVKNPFLMVYSLYAVHIPLQAPKALIDKYREKQKRLGLTDKDRFRKDEPWMKNEKDWKTRIVQDNPVYAAMVDNMDWNIGRLLDAVRQNGLDENTVIIFTSDNGGLSTLEGSPTVNGPLKAGKGWLYEGGIRVPLIIYWMGKLSAGSISALPVSTVDIFPTLASIIDPNYRKASDIDGEDILPLISNPAATNERTICWYYPHYSNQGGKPGAAIRKGMFKLIYNYESDKSELYDLQTDISEKKDLSAIRRSLTKRLKKELFRWLNRQHASAPRKNNGYDPFKTNPE